MFPSFFMYFPQSKIMYKIHFAPLQGYTEDAYRRLHNHQFGGVTDYYTPFIRLEHGTIRSKDQRDIRPDFNQGVNIVPQIIASGGQEAQTLIATLRDLHYSRIDINMGCPFPLQTRHGRGAGLFDHPERVQEIADVILQHPDLQFSVKMRLGLTSPDQWNPILSILADLPLLHITMHPRIATQQYKGELNMPMFDTFLAECPHPVIYNGDITTLQDLHRLETTYGDRLAGVMIGRGLLARPSLAQEYTTGTTLTDRQLITQIRQLHNDYHQHLATIIPGEAQLFNKLRTFWDYLEPTIGRKPWKKITKAGNLKNYLQAIQDL